MAQRLSSDVVILQSRVRTREQVDENAKRAVVAIFKLLSPSMRKRLANKAFDMRDAIVREFQP